MTSDFKYRIIVQLLFLLNASAYSQELKVTLDDNAKSIDRNASKGVSTIVFDSKVKDLEIEVNGACEMITPKDNFFVFRIDTKNDSQDVLFQSSDIQVSPIIINRIFSLKSPKSNVYRLQMDISPNSMYYYTVILPEQYAKNFSAEYLFTKSSMHGIRVSYGKRLGLYLSYKWGDYKKAGSNIDNVAKDYDVTQSKKLGYIRTSFTGGLCIGVIHTDKMSLYALLGGGYGDYGRQWQNQTEIDNNIYFYSDYIKGFNGDLACQIIMFDWLCLSVGADVLFGKGKVSLDYQLGIGATLPLDKLFKIKKI